MTITLPVFARTRDTAYVNDSSLSTLLRLHAGERSTQILNELQAVVIKKNVLRATNVFFLMELKHIDKFSADGGRRTRYDTTGHTLRGVPRAHGGHAFACGGIRYGRAGVE